MKRPFPSRRPSAPVLALPLLVALAGVSSLAACGDSEDDDAATAPTEAELLTGGLFLKASQLEVKSTKTLGADEVAREVDDLSEITIDDGSDSSGATGGEDKAYDACMEKGQGGTIKVVGNTVALSADAKPFECKDKDGDVTKVTKYKFHVAGTCKQLAKGVKELDGKPLSAADDMEGGFCADGSDQTFLNQVEIAQSSSGKDGSFAFRVVSNSSKTGFAPCAQVATKTDGCVHTNILDVSSSFGGQKTAWVSKTVLTADDLVAKTETQKYYESGSWVVDLDGWKGKITYAGKDTPPTWSLTKGSETKTGKHGDGDAAPTGPTDGDGATDTTGGGDGTTTLTGPAPTMPADVARALAASQRLTRLFGR